MQQTDETDVWNRRMEHTNGTDVCNRLMKQTYGTDWWNRRRHVEQTDGTDWWNRLMEQTDGTDWWNRQMELTDGTGRRNSLGTKLFVHCRHFPDNSSLRLGIPLWLLLEQSLHMQPLQTFRTKPYWAIYTNHCRLLGRTPHWAILHMQPLPNEAHIGRGV